MKFFLSTTTVAALGIFAMIFGLCANPSFAMATAACPLAASTSTGTTAGVPHLGSAMEEPPACPPGGVTIGAASSTSRVSTGADTATKAATAAPVESCRDPTTMTTTADNGVKTMPIRVNTKVPPAYYKSHKMYYCTCSFRDYSILFFADMIRILTGLYCVVSELRYNTWTRARAPYFLPKWFRTMYASDGFKTLVAFVFFMLSFWVTDLFVKVPLGLVVYGCANYMWGPFS